MSQSMTFTFGPWLPDSANQGITVSAQQSNVTLPLADCLNVVWTDGEYRSLLTPVNVSTSLAFVAGIPLGAYTALDPGGNPALFFGTATQLYGPNQLTGSFTTIGSGGYVATQWSFCQSGPQMFATDASLNCVDGLQTWGFESNPAVTTVSGAPCCNVVATVGQFVMVGDLGTPTTFGIGTANGTLTSFGGTSTAFPIRPGTVRLFLGATQVGSDTGYGLITGATLSSGQVAYDTGVFTVTFTTAPASGAVTVKFVQAAANRVQWSAIGNPTNWPTPLTNPAIAAQSGYQDNDADLGPVMAIAGFPLYCLIFQKGGITRANYVGGQVVFSFGAYERKRGLVARKAFVQVSNSVYFLAEDGFFVTDGANVTPIGTAGDNSTGIDGWFWANVYRPNISQITAGYDATLRCVVFLMPTATGVTMLLYNPMAAKWTKAASAATLIWTDTDGTRHKLGLFSFVSPNSYYQNLTGVPAQAYIETCDTIFDDGNIRYTMGAIPNIDCTDTPLTMIGTRPALSRNVSYSRYAAQDQFTTIAPFMVHGRYTRARVASNNANAINGVTLMFELGGGM